MTHLRHTVRFLAAHRSFTAAAMFTLAIGLGANTALFGLINLVSRPLDIPHAGQLVSIGAQPRDVLRLILGQGLRVVVVGLAIGLGLSWILARALTSFIPLARADWLTFGSVAAGLGLLAVWACYVPARRATSVPAMTALRHE